MGTIRNEIRQTKPFPSGADEAVVTLLATADRVRTRFGRLTAAHGITFQQYNVLRILRGAGDAGLPTLDIAARMIEESPGITRLLDRLERRGLVTRERCPADGRQVLCRATPAAHRLLTELDCPVAESGDGLVPFGRERAQQLIAMLDEIRSRAVAAPAPGDRPPEAEPADPESSIQ
jgi:DNA-binding MarR family transcriptional regulator